MKQKTLLLSLALISGLSAWGQTYESVFGEDSMVMYTIYFVPDSRGDLVEYTGFKGDTIIRDGETYQKMFEKFPSGIGLSVLPLMESEDHSKLWLYDEFDEGNEKKLLMDLSLSVGDTMWISRLTGYVLITDVREEEGRKVLVTNYPGLFALGDTTHVRFIEGIGPTAGPLYPVFSNGSTLQCLFKGGALAYTHPTKADTMDCNQNFTWTSIEDNPLSAIQFSQSSDGGIYLIGPDLRGAEVEVLDLTGRQVYAEASNTSSEIHLSLATLTPGLYVLTLREVDGKVTTWKFQR